MAIDLIIARLRADAGRRAQADTYLRRELMRYSPDHPERRFAEEMVEFVNKLADQSAEALAILEAHERGIPDGA